MTGEKGREGRFAHPCVAFCQPSAAFPTTPSRVFPTTSTRIFPFKRARFPIQAGAFLPTLTVHPTRLVLRDSPINLVRFFHLGVHSYPHCRGDLDGLRAQARPLLSPFEYFP